jgi:signal transduction histidine kinase
VLVVDSLVAVAVAGLLMSLSVVSLSAIVQPAAWTVAVVSAFVVLHASLALRRVAPVPGYLVACAAMTVVVLAPEGQVEHPVDGGIDAFPLLFLPSSLTFLPVLYAVCARGGRREAVAAIAMAAFGVALASARAGDQVVPPGYPPAVQYRLYLALALLSSVSAAWGLGMSRAAQAARETARRAEATRTAVLADRVRIARDMHDVVAHSLAVIVRQAEGGALLAERSPGRAEQVLRTIAQVGREALTDMRGMLAVMRDPDLTDPPGSARPADPHGHTGGGTRIGAWFSLAELPALLDRVRGAGLDLHLTECGTRHDIGPAAELAAYHVLQEALTNAVKHAGPGTRVGVTLDWQPESLVFEVHDDGPAGSGPGTHPPVPGTGSGLGGLHERMAAVGGTLSAGPEGAGFTVRARIPRRGSAAGQP